MPLFNYNLPMFIEKLVSSFIIIYVVDLHQLCLDHILELPIASHVRLFFEISLNLIVDNSLPFDQIGIYHSMQGVSIDIHNFFVDAFFETKFFVLFVQSALDKRFVIQKFIINVLE